MAMFAKKAIGVRFGLFLHTLVPKLPFGNALLETPFRACSPLRTRYRIFDNDHPHFMTCTIAGWLAVFTRPEAVQMWRCCAATRFWNIMAQKELPLLCRIGVAVQREGVCVAQQFAQQSRPQVRAQT
jgi:hypothetical protein